MLNLSGNRWNRWFTLLPDTVVGVVAVSIVAPVGGGAPVTRTGVLSVLAFATGTQSGDVVGTTMSKMPLGYIPRFMEELL